MHALVHHHRRRHTINHLLTCTCIVFFLLAAEMERGRKALKVLKSIRPEIQQGKFDMIECNDWTDECAKLKDSEQVLVVYRLDDRKADSSYPCRRVGGSGASCPKRSRRRASGSRHLQFSFSLCLCLSPSLSLALSLLLLLPLTP